MADLIDREELIEQLREKIQDNPISNVWNSAINCAYKIIKVQPSADTERHAHWETDKNGCHRCTGCNRYALANIKTSFCARCGCRMDEVVGNE